MTAEHTTTASAPRRILDATRDLAMRGGPAAISMGDVAAAAAVSKALVHYHFHDKDRLLIALVEDLGAGVAQRTRGAVAGAIGEEVLDRYWTWMEGEIARGDARVLVSLGETDSEAVRTACRRVAQQRRDEGARVIEAIYAQLGLKLRVPAQLVAAALSSFLDGQAFAHALAGRDARGGQDARAAFDVLWLALLTLAE